MGEVVRVICPKRYANTTVVTIAVPQQYADDVRTIMEGLGFTTEHFDVGSHDVYYKKPVCNFEMHRALFGPEHEEKLYEYYVKHPERMPREMQVIAEREGRERAAVDYISGMTDGYAMEKFGEIFIPFAWTVK